MHLQRHLVGDAVVVDIEAGGAVVVDIEVEIAVVVSKRIKEEEEAVAIARRGRHRRRGPTNARPPIRKAKKTKIKSKKIELLNAAKQTEIRYFIDEILADQIGDDKEPLITTLVVKGTRESKEASVDFLDMKISDGVISENVRKPILDVIQRFTVKR